MLLVGGRFSEVPSQGYPLLDIPVPRQTLVHVHPDPDELGRVYRADLAAHASPVAFAQAVCAHGERVTDTASFAPALQRALASGKPALLQCLIDPQAITPTATLDSLRQQGFARCGIQLRGGRLRRAC